MRISERQHASEVRRAEFEADITKAAIVHDLTIAEIVTSLSHLTSRYSRHVMAKDIADRAHRGGDETT